MIQLTATADFTGYDQAVAQTHQALGSAMRIVVNEAGRAAEEHARTNHKHKKRTGFLTSRSALKFLERRSGGDLVEGELTNIAPYARYVEYGTRAHIILAKNAQALRFVQAGKVRFAKSVRHPGTDPLPFMQPGVEHAFTVMVQGFHREFDYIGDTYWK